MIFRKAMPASHGDHDHGHENDHGHDHDAEEKSGHAIAMEFRHELLHHLKYLSDATIHVDPAAESGTDHHQVAEHSHEGLPPHSH
jgi:hypothetical protein